ncbi:RluA family pseudouridine synthase [Treponema parvum]|uniref:RluA family pseudouridine synthase n=1 Tax=Treponema parvum TaxID=138851 RepID=A0A975F5H8_9SPIR|nr:RluA family pseudouridine synthase [Treponema parvum]QTQ14678.1 RluA family pseudouridine synthase [Treponema parvum]
MFPPFPEKEAFDECLRMIEELKAKTLVIKQISKVSEERSDHGIMLGVLVCKDSASGKVVVLRTLSGISRSLKPLDTAGKRVRTEIKTVYVDPIVPPQKISSALLQNDKEIHDLTEKIKYLKPLRKGANGKYADPEGEEKKLIEKRNFLCRQSQQKVFDLYFFHCADGKIRSLNEICGLKNRAADAAQTDAHLYAAQAADAASKNAPLCAARILGAEKFPPTGTGECCAPKLLNFAFMHSLVPLSLCEVFYDADNKGKPPSQPSSLSANIRDSYVAHAPCDKRCALILPGILGLNILYRDNSIIVINKQSGLLSVPGRGIQKQDCAVNRLRRLFPNCIAQPSVHRLDMETSGLMVLAFTEDAHRNLCLQFEKGLVKKRYTALLDGNLYEKRVEDHGQMELYFRLDINNRPHQIWDEIHGKKAVTRWDIIGLENYTAPDGSLKKATRVIFTPLTGRTHQLRLASNDIHGFDTPIIGDSLYGKCMDGERLLLHAHYLSFDHPETGNTVEFTCPCPF